MRLLRNSMDTPLAQRPTSVGIFVGGYEGSISQNGLFLDTPPATASLVTWHNMISDMYSLFISARGLVPNTTLFGYVSSLNNHMIASWESVFPQLAMDIFRAQFPAAGDFVRPYSSGFSPLVPSPPVAPSGNHVPSTPVTAVALLAVFLAVRLLFRGNFL